jgi:hypothetical protein
VPLTPLRSGKRPNIDTGDLRDADDDEPHRELAERHRNGEGDRVRPPPSARRATQAEELLDGVPT